MHGPDSKMPWQEEMGGFQMTKVDIQNEQPQGICTWGPHKYIEIVANLLKPSPLAHVEVRSYLCSL